MGDVLEELRDVGGLVSHSYKLTYGWVPPKFKKHNFYQTVKRLLKTGYIEKIYKNGEPYLRLTNQGTKKIIRVFPLFKITQRKWDGQWTVIVFDIRETKRWVRNLLREQLVRLGCGMLQRSVYITPHNITYELKGMIEYQGLQGMVRVFRAPLLFEEDEKELANRVWKLDNLNEHYYKVLRKWERKKEELVGKKKEIFIRRLRNLYFEALVKDPILPKELLPNDWVGEKVHNLIRSLN